MKQKEDNSTIDMFEQQETESFDVGEDASHVAIYDPGAKIVTNFDSNDIHVLECVDFDSMSRPDIDEFFNNAFEIVDTQVDVYVKTPNDEHNFILMSQERYEALLNIINSSEIV